MESQTSILFILLATVGVIALAFTVYAIARRFLSSKRKAAILSLLMAPLLFFVLIFLANFSQRAGKAVSFNREQWYKGEKERRQMCDVILSTGVLTGRTLPEVEDILGKPEVQVDSAIYYRLDLKKPISTSEKLTIIFADGVVSETLLE